MDMPSLQVQLNSLLNIPHVTRAQVEANGRILASAGSDRPEETAVWRSFPLSYNFDGRIIPQGDLKLKVNYGGISKDLLSKAHVRFLFQLGHVVLVAVFMLYIFRQIVTRRLVVFESHISELNRGGTNDLVLPKPMFFKGNDELDMLVQTFNGMSGQLRELIAGMKQREEMLYLKTVELEGEVAERQMAQENLQDKALLLEEEIEKRQEVQDELERLNERLEQRVEERTAELRENYAELEKMNKIFVGRELRMVELKERIVELEKQIREFNERGGA
jgi:nitrate/nitrite-specific signal transduction histidine kinase